MADQIQIHEGHRRPLTAVPKSDTGGPAVLAGPVTYTTTDPVRAGLHKLGTTDGADPAQTTLSGDVEVWCPTGAVDAGVSHVDVIINATAEAALDSSEAPHEVTDVLTVRVLPNEAASLNLGAGAETPIPAVAAPAPAPAAPAPAAPADQQPPPAAPAAPAQ